MTQGLFLPSMPLVEPIIATMKGLLATNLPAVVTTANTNITDGFPIPAPVQYLDYFPFAAELQGGMPIVAVGEASGGGDFMDDLQTSVDAEYQYVVAVIHQEADHQTLVKNLRRLMVCVAYTIQTDRLLGIHSVMRSTPTVPGGVWSVCFERMEPGPMLGDLDPENVNAPPRSWLSWTSLLLSSKHGEVY